ncbi:procathepsin L-like isoform X2 [Anguilla rostrata]|uniref:procathepsin L-like isoform X2 n=1 Tax=Anguilla rostrata TaxID=7938 RepID=UPI0030CB6495
MPVSWSSEPIESTSKPGQTAPDDHCLQNQGIADLCILQFFLQYTMKVQAANCFLAWLVLLYGVVTSVDPDLDAEWQQWNIKYNGAVKKTRSLIRREIWEDNYRFIEDHNKRYKEGKETYELGLNVFGDLNTDEFVEVTKASSMVGTPKSSNLMLSAAELRHAASELNSKSIDYRDMGYITPVEDQGFCGSCWAYSATGALEAQWKKKTGELIPLSKQQLVDCSTSTGNKACVGGRPSLAYMYIMQNGGIQAEDSYPYVMEERNCVANRSKNVVSVKDWKYVPPGDEQAFEDALVTIGPIAVVIDTTTRNFQFYRKGVFYDPKCSIWKQAHAVVLIGFGTEGPEEYWTIKNSWGVYWGEEGYMRLAKNRQRHCGISQYGVVPFV